MDLSNKKTTLDDSASIYQIREEKTDRMKWKECKGFRAKWEHFREYYLLKTFIWACVIGFVGYAVYEIVKPKKETVLYIAFTDAVVTAGEMDKLQEGYEAYVTYDKDEQTMIFDNDMMISNRADAASAQRFTAHAVAGDIDIIVGVENVMKGLAGAYMWPVEEQISPELYALVEDRLCYAVPTDVDGNPGEEAPYGIYITDLVEPHSVYAGQELVLAITGNTKRQVNAENFIRYLLGIEKLVSAEADSEEEKE